AGRRSKRHIDSTGLFIQRQIPTPDIHTGPIFPTIVEPSLMSRLTGARNRVEFPKLLAPPDIEGARIAGISALGDLAHGRAKYCDLFVDGRTPVRWTLDAH